MRKVRLVKFTKKIPNNDKSDYETEYCWRRGTLLNEGTETEETADANEHENDEAKPRSPDREQGEHS